MTATHRRGGCQLCPESAAPPGQPGWCWQGWTRERGAVEISKLPRWRITQGQAQTWVTRASLAGRLSEHSAGVGLVALQGPHSQQGQRKDKSSKRTPTPDGTRGLKGFLREGLLRVTRPRTQSHGLLKGAAPCTAANFLTPLKAKDGWRSYPPLHRFVNPSGLPAPQAEESLDTFSNPASEGP